MLTILNDLMEIIIYSTALIIKQIVGTILGIVIILLLLSPFILFCYILKAIVF